MSAAEPAVVRLDAVPSTMDALHELAEQGAPPGTAVVAEVQTAGRGSRGRAWASPPGGLWLSVLVRPAPERLELVSLRAGLAVADALERFGIGERIAIKWPNDLMLGDRKTGGLLCEARWHGATPAWIVIGLGLNVANPPGPSLAATATHLAAARPGLEPTELVEPIVAALRAMNSPSGPLTPAEQARFAHRDWLRGQAIEQPVAGTVEGIAPDGALRVRAGEGQIVEARAGTVVLRGTRSAPLAG